MTPLISVITPVYNNKKYLIKCAESILSQQFSNIEYIIVDDGSTDGTSELCDKIKSKDPRVRVIHQENQWIYESFNNGIKAAIGEYIYIVNSDDILMEGTLSKFIDIISKYDPDVIWTAVKEVVCDEEQKPISESICGLAGELYPNNIFLNNSIELHEHWRELHYYGFLVNQANLYRRSLMLSHPFRNDVYGADSLFNISIADNIEKSYILAEPVYNFNVYKTDNMNASVGKVYGYEFDMFSEMMRGHVNLLKKWHISLEDILYFENIQIGTCINCLQILENPKFSYTADEKINIMIKEYFNDRFYEDVRDINCFERVDSEVTKRIITYIIKGELCKDDIYYFFVPFFNAINNQTKSDDDWIAIDNAINNPLNPYHYGISICKKLGI